MYSYQVQAIIPYYTSCGENGTYIIRFDGTKEVLTIPIRSYLRRMLYEAHLDPKALQHWTHKTIGTKLVTPITLNEHLIFIPIKMRHAIGKSDGAFGYILSHNITHYDDYLITLSPDLPLTTLSPKSYITKKLRDAKLLRYAYLEHRRQYDFMHQ